MPNPICAAGGASHETAAERRHFMRRLGAVILGRQGGMAVILLLSLVGAYYFVFRGVRFFLVPSGSMEPTLMRGDYIVTLREAAYQRGEIVVFLDLVNNEYVVKRIAGVAGDAIGVQAGALFINGEYASEPYIAEPMRYVVDPPIIIEPDRVFVLGDNRNASDDSHVRLNTEPAADIIGRVCFRYYPYSRFGPVRSYPLRPITEQ